MTEWVYIYDFISIFNVISLKSWILKSWKGFVEVSNFLTDILILQINMPAGYNQNFLLCPEDQGFLTSAVVLRNLDHIDVCV